MLERVAREVQNCIEFYDSVALSATTSRLLRMDEQSVTAIWDLQDRMHWAQGQMNLGCGDGI